MHHSSYAMVRVITYASFFSAFCLNYVKIDKCIGPLFNLTTVSCHFRLVYRMNVYHSSYCPHARLSSGGK